MLQINGEPEKHWVVGNNAIGITGRAFTQEMHTFEKGAQRQIDELLRADPSIARLNLRPVLVEVTVRLCNEVETQEYQATQQRWLAEKHKQLKATTPPR